MDALEKEVESLKAQLSTPSSTESPGGVARVTQVTAPISENAGPGSAAPLDTTGTSVAGSTGSQKRSRAHFEAGTPPTIPELDPISAGLITPEAAGSYFSTFFSGCDRYVPVFDPRYDTLESVRYRSTLLFSALCSVGCRVLTGSESYHSRALGVHTQRMLHAAIAAAAPSRGAPQACLETVQALLVRACYAPERSLLVAVATRMALEIGLPEAYGVLSARCVTRPQVGVMRATGTQSPGVSATSPVKADEDDTILMRKTRTWLHLLMMGQILHVDAGGPPGFRFRGAAQRCRILIDSPSSTGIDLYLFSQVELNTIRARIHSTFSHYVRQNPGERDDDEIMEMVGDAKIDINVWFDDWTRIYEKHRTHMPWLIPNLAVQRCWADSMAMCAALKAAGIEDVSAMSVAQREILGMAKRSLNQHLDIILEEPRLYLRSIRYAMDFVWAKNAFCYLLLLKLFILLPDDGDISGPSSNDELMEKGRMLVDELSKAGGGLKDGARNNTSSLYLHLVRVSIDKFSHAIRLRSQRGAPIIGPQAARNDAPDSRNGVLSRQGRGGGGNEGEWSIEDSQTELESFVPEQFVFEWDFPGLTFFSSPTHETGWLDEMLAGAFDGADSFYTLGWASMDFSLA
ncbi:hypothetical protein C8A00DRAFT_18078 [Chaetomidium leptoderma]|uniref:Transcription factor domain-containing protein n=1 Tax=Chaetomidium leptoderma TaxID=669021 RepID=A0AAN6ZU57_9PEZI|nr:hypothetical protein C8A00DRAFT_18078 [Chaetomidium leptoderma]